LTKQAGHCGKVSGLFKQKKITTRSYLTWNDVYLLFTKGKRKASTKMKSGRMKMVFIKPKRNCNFNVATLPFWQDNNNLLTDLQRAANSHLTPA